MRTIKGLLYPIDRSPSLLFRFADDAYLLTVHHTALINGFYHTEGVLGEKGKDFLLTSKHTFTGVEAVMTILPDSLSTPTKHQRLWEELNAPEPLKSPQPA